MTLELDEGSTTRFLLVLLVGILAWVGLGLSLWVAFCHADTLVAAGPLHAQVRRGDTAFVSVAMGGEPMEGVRPTLSGIVYDPTGRMRRLRRKPLHADWSQHLAWQVRPTDPVGRWTVYVTFERDTRAWGLPATVEVTP